MRILYVTTISLTMNSFFKPHIEMLVREGHHVDIACNYKDLALDGLYDTLGCDSYQIDFSRSPLSTDNIKAYGQLNHVIQEGNYDIVHCHTPNASICTRLACKELRKKGLKVIYTAHGFHFYKGAPLKNWLMYYPIEKYCSKFTDVLITINQEDYKLAKDKMKAKQIAYVPGVGINVKKFQNAVVDRTSKRQEIGVPEDAMLLLSVGELNENKNHQVVIKALSEVKISNIHYVIAGKGTLKQELISLAKMLGVEKQVHLLGYRNDVAELYKMADVFIHPSKREGAPVAMMEAMASGKPCIASNIRGNTDLINESGGILFNPDKVEECYNAILNMLNGDRKHMGEVNENCAKKYSIDEIIMSMKSIYES